MSSIIKKTALSLMLLLIYPMTALADIKIILNTPGYKYNPYNYKHYNPKSYSKKYHNNKYKYKKHRYKKEKFNKYDFAPYSYRSNQHYYSYGNKKYYYPVRPRYNVFYNYSPYAYNYNRYNHQKEKAYWQGYKDGYNQQRKNQKLGK